MGEQVLHITSKLFIGIKEQKTGIKCSQFLIALFKAHDMKDRPVQKALLSDSRVSSLQLPPWTASLGQIRL